MMRLWQWVVRLTSVFGLVVGIILFTPVTVAWAQWIASPWEESRAEVVVVMAGSQLRNGMLGYSSYWRSVYSALIYREGGVRKIIISGGSGPLLPPIAEEMRKYLVASGVPNEIIVTETESTNTQGSVDRLRTLLAADPRKTVLVTSDYHVYRASRFFRRAGINMAVRTVPDAGKRGSSVEGRWGAFCDLSVETAKIVYYLMRGEL